MEAPLWYVYGMRVTDVLLIACGFVAAGLVAVAICSILGV